MTIARNIEVDPEVMPLNEVASTSRTSLTAIFHCQVQVPVHARKSAIQPHLFPSHDLPVTRSKQAKKCLASRTEPLLFPH